MYVTYENGRRAYWRPVSSRAGPAYPSGNASKSFVHLQNGRRKSFGPIERVANGGIFRLTVHKVADSRACRDNAILIGNLSRVYKYTKRVKKRKYLSGTINFRSVKNVNPTSVPVDAASVYIGTAANRNPVKLYIF